MTDTTAIVTLPSATVAQHPDNIRDAGRDIAALTESIRAGGIRIPLIVVPVTAVSGHEFPDHITHVAIDGNRRVAAAQTIGADLPCIIREDLAGTRETIRTMVITGLARDGLTTTETIGAVQTMLDLGMTQTAISRDAGLTTKTDRAAKKAATLRPDSIDQADYPLTLDQLADLADWQDDPAAVERLKLAAERGTWDHVIARLKRDQVDQAAIATTAADLTDRGIAVIQARPSFYDAPVRLDAILTADGAEITDESHTTCPGHAAHVDIDHDGTSITYACTSPTDNGHTYRYTRGGGATPTAAGPMTDEQKQERADLIRRNREMLAAGDVRHAFIRNAAGSRQNAKAMTEWAMSRIISRDSTVARWLGHYNPTIPGQLLGRDDTRPIKEVLGNIAPTKQAQTLWLIVCCAYEAEWTKDCWRSPNDGRRAYLAHLVDLGYTPCDTEQLLLGQVPTTDNEPVDVENHQQ